MERENTRVLEEDGIIRGKKGKGELIEEGKMCVG